MSDRRPPKAEDPLDYPFVDTGEGKPAPGETMEVAPGIHWLRMPLPFQLNHINLWLLETDDGWVLVDCGLKLDTTKDFWRTLFAAKSIGAKFGRPVERLVVTHFHPDHIGLAGWLVRELETELWITRTEWLMARMLYLDNEATNHNTMARFYASHGLDPDLAERLFKGGNTYRDRVDESPLHHRRLQHGDRLSIGGRTWRIIVGTGHAPEHACLYCEEANVLISGDQILPKITPNISVWASEPDANPLGDFLGSMGRFRDLPEDTLVLPSHGFPFFGLHTRVDALIQHHQEKLTKLRDWINGAAVTAADTLPVLFRPDLDMHQTGFAMGEALAHLAYLEGVGELRRDRAEDGLYRFQSA
jgi:glyoxylase-like metal-dependent hydrolase (beta-lactamase superfamily II)